MARKFGVVSTVLILAVIGVTVAQQTAKDCKPGEVLEIGSTSNSNPIPTPQARIIQMNSGSGVEQTGKCVKCRDKFAECRACTLTECTRCSFGRKQYRTDAGVLECSFSLFVVIFWPIIAALVIFIACIVTYHQKLQRKKMVSEAREKYLQLR
jgi:hypothetical protein